jgi:acetyl-CoA C-acetyltransferase
MNKPSAIVVAVWQQYGIGATGAVLTTRLLHSMRRDGLKRGVVIPGQP